MFFCDNCGYNLDVVKTGDTSLEVQHISSPEEFVRKMSKKKGIDEFKYILEFTQDDLKEYLIKGKKNEGVQELMLKKYQTYADNDTPSSFLLSCGNCKQKYPLLPGKVLYSLTLSGTVNIKDIESELRCADPTLPRTKDYICKNAACPTHDLANKKVQMEKEAVFYRPGVTFDLKYACCVCYTSWHNTGS